MPLRTQAQSDLTLFLPLVFFNARFVPVIPARHVRTIDTSVWQDYSSDPSGIDVFPATATVSLLISGTTTALPLAGQYIAVDSEVEEPNNAKLVNTFIFDHEGNQLAGWPQVLSRTAEPTGVAVVEEGRCVIFSTDTTPGRLDQICVGPDHTYQTADDELTRVRLSGVLSITLDLEDIAYHPENNVLYLIGGSQKVIGGLDLGANRRLDAVGSPSDDDVVLGVLFTTGALAESDVEGAAICRTPAGTTMVMVSNVRHIPLASEVTLAGHKIRTIDFALEIRSKAGLLCEVNPAHGLMTLWVTDRGVDNEINPDENDGKIYVFEVAL
jgi:hypothetical protein